MFTSFVVSNRCWLRGSSENLAQSYKVTSYKVFEAEVWARGFSQVLQSCVLAKAHFLKEMLYYMFISLVVPHRFSLRGSSENRSRNQILRPKRVIVLIVTGCHMHSFAVVQFYRFVVPQLYDFKNQDLIVLQWYSCQFRSLPCVNGTFWICQFVVSHLYNFIVA